MLNNRQTYAKQVNDMFGLNISVELNSSWKQNKIEQEQEIKAIDENDRGDDNGTETVN
jgi:hypothetical protein